ncbi:MAG: TVP38/TMEM64 family protein, partial [Planctomycetaceae bacterium]
MKTGDAAAPESNDRDPGRPRWRSTLTRLTLFILIGGGMYWLRDQVHLQQLIPYETQLRSLVAEHPAVALGIAFVVYVLIVGLSLPGASILTPLAGWLFGFWRGVLFASFAATAGATLAFLLSRFFLRDLVERRWNDRLQMVNAAFDSKGVSYLFSLRLVPAVPFFLVNLLMGLTRIRTRTFWWVSQLGMLPGTCLFILAGATAPTLTELSQSKGAVLNWKWLAALTALGLLPLTMRAL